MINVQNKTRRPFCFGGGFEIVFALVLSLVRQRPQHDRRPATGMVVVMPISMMAAIRAEHRSRLITEKRCDCQ
jgi:hypothetical protein